MLNRIPVISLFSGAGGLDLGFHQAGFDTVFANEYDKSIWATFEHNFPNVPLDKRSIVDVASHDIPNAVGIIGGPPCQSWSEAGAGRGINDQRGKLFYEYIRVLRDKEPLFFLAENVAGIVSSRHKKSFSAILEEFKSLNYNVSYFLLDTNNFAVPQTRKRVIIVGYHKKLNKSFTPPKTINPKPTLYDAISDLAEAKPAKDKNYANDNLDIANHEYMTGSFSSIYMSRNRVRSWDEPSFTIQAGGRHAPIHPQAPKMQFIEQNKRIFVQGKEHLYRRMSVRECARVQTFPDDFIFLYDKVADGYKMVGNAVPVNFAKYLANVIYHDIVKTNFRKDCIDKVCHNNDVELV